MSTIKRILPVLILIVIVSAGFVSIKSDNNAHSNTNDVFNIFKGKINQENLNGAVFTGTIVYDRDCKNIGKDLTHCDAGIKTKKYGTINYSYTHNMSKKYCLTNDDIVLVKVKKNKHTFVVR